MKIQINNKLKPLLVGRFSQTKSLFTLINRLIVLGALLVTRADSLTVTIPYQSNILIWPALYSFFNLSWGIAPPSFSIIMPDSILYI